MVGSRREDVNPVITSSNIFAALEKKKSKKKDSKKDSKKDKTEEKPSADALEKLLATPIAVSSWADCDDDDDFGAIGPVPKWGDEAEKDKHEESKALSHDEESDEEGFEHEDEHEEEEHEEEEVPEEKPEPAPRVRVVPAPREPEKQLSKKELKKKELEELEHVLKEFGISPVQEVVANGSGSSENVKSTEGEDKEEGEPGQAPTSKNKNKKKKEKKKERGDDDKEEATNTEQTRQETGDTPAEFDSTVDSNGVSMDPAEVLKRLKSQKSKGKGDDVKARAKAALEEAAARKAKLAKAKSKDKKHYNQQPVR